MGLQFFNWSILPLFLYNKVINPNFMDFVREFCIKILLNVKARTGANIVLNF